MQCHDGSKSKFTWWGGVLGPRILKHVKCGSCGKGYNGKTGKDNFNGIVIYSVVLGLIGVGFMIVFFALFVVVVLMK